MCGEVTMFVNLADYTGTPIDVLIAEGSLTTEELPSDREVKLFGQAQLNIMKYLALSASAQAEPDAGPDSDINANRVTALTMNVDTLYANKIKANQIEGLEIYTDKIDSLSRLYEKLQGQGDVAGVSTSGDGVDTEAKTFVSLAVLAQFESQGSLVVGGTSEFKGESLFNGLVTYARKVVFRDKVGFESAPIFNSSTGGYAIVQTGESSVYIK
jgi:hypothetical protein